MNTPVTETSPVKEPAIQSYFFGKGYLDLRNTIVDSWRRNSESAFIETEGVGFIAGCLRIIRFAAGIAIYLFGTPFFLIASGMHIIILFAFFLLVYIGFSLTFLTDWIYRAVHGFFTVCPKCHHKSPLPEFACPNCHRWHGQLTPNKYGILHHTCLCGEKMPCVFFLGRSQLESRCSSSTCATHLDVEHTDSRKVFIPVLGSVAAGKTVFLTTALEYYRKLLIAGGRTAVFHDPADESEFQDILQRLNGGHVPDKTVSLLPRAKALSLNSVKNQENRLLYFYDPAGEAFQDGDLLVSHSYFAYLSGIVLLIDPFVFEEFRSRLENLAYDDLNRTLPTEVFNRILNNMQQNFGHSVKNKIRVPVAVVLTKMDMLSAASQLPPPTELASATTPGYTETIAAYSQQVRLLLQEVGLEWVVQQLETHCANIAYFSCSALGRRPGENRDPFQGWGCFEPIAWILSQKNKDYLPIEI